MATHVFLGHGGALEISRSEWFARLVSVLFSTLTVLPFWGIAVRAFSIPVAVYSSLSFVLLGICVGYSVTTSSEVLTVFFVVFGVYAWLRYRCSESYAWAVLSGLGSSAACLIRYEPWIAVITLCALSLQNANVDSVPHSRWRTLMIFAAFALAGAFCWSAFSYLKWHDPFFSARFIRPKAGWEKLGLSVRAMRKTWLFGLGLEMRLSRLWQENDDRLYAIDYGIPRP
jgi:4-amino-4-deoxy-L-arabinose transferase-like glycosyltransferase